MIQAFCCKLLFSMFVSWFPLLLNIFSFSVARSNDNPRVVLAEKDVPVRWYRLPGNNRRIELVQGPHNNSLFVGGHGRLWYIDFNRPNLSKEVKFPELERETSNSKANAPSDYEYDVTTLHRVNATLLFVCGSNGKQPKCCFMSTKMLEMKCSEDIKARGIAPLNVTEQAPSLYLEEDVYAAVNIDLKGNSVALRRIGQKAEIWPDIDKKEQKYVSMAFSGPREDRLQDRVYAFLMQKRSDEDPEVSSWTSWVSQVCKADMGGSKVFLKKAWTSRLNARLSCGVRDRKLFFNELLDVTILQEANWKKSRVYGLFKNSWGMTAVCVYLMEDIDHIFKGLTGTVPDQKPGECVQDSTKLDTSVLRHMKDNPDMKEWVWPMNSGGPLMVTDNTYRHIRVDSVRGGGHGRKHYSVLFLSLENGSVHKVLEHAGEPFIIAELHPFRSRTEIQNMLLQPSTKKLYISSSREVAEVDLEGCQSYGQECEDCIQARDPYCSWNGTHCAATSKYRKLIQDVEHGHYSVCKQSEAISARSLQNNVESVPVSSKYFLRCPMFSNHAKYSWHHNGTPKECLLAGGSCLLLIDSMTDDQSGSYMCVSSEEGYERTLAYYQLQIESRTQGMTASPLALACLLLFLALIR